jgi:hypothetical protein
VITKITYDVFVHSDNSALITPDLEATVGMSMPEPTVGPTLYTEATFLSSTTEPTQLPTLDPWVLVCLNFRQNYEYLLTICVCSTDSASPLDLTAEEHDAAEPYATSLPTISAPGDQNIDAMFFSAP